MKERPPSKHLQIAHRPKVSKFNVTQVLKSSRGTGISEVEVRQVLASTKLGKALPDEVFRDWEKGMMVKRATEIQAGIKECNRILQDKAATSEEKTANHTSKLAYLKELGELNKEIGVVGATVPSQRNGAAAPHSFGPREQIGNVAAVQVSIVQAKEQPPVTDVTSEKSAENPA